MKGCQSKPKRSAENTEAWILGSGTASLASALYLFKHAKVHPSKIHVLDKHISLEQASHHKGDSLGGYDQFAGCLPIPVGSLMKELLATIPSATAEGQSVLDEIQKAEANRLSAKGDDHTCFVALKNGAFEHIPIESLNLSLKHRTSLILFFLKREKYLTGSKIRDVFPASFFESPFWTVWSVQFGFQPWHSAAEFRRALRQYLPEFHTLSILSCLDITGYYQYESVYLPIYFYLRSCDVDFQFGVDLKNIEITKHHDQQTITGLDLIREGHEVHKSLGKDDIVIATLGSTISGSEIGTNENPPLWQSMAADDMLDQNWSAWLDLGNKHPSFGNPYHFCTRQHESMLESFTITTEDLGLWENLQGQLRCTSEAGAFLFLEDSAWKINLSIPPQPVFSEQPSHVRVLWGFAHSPLCDGNYVQKPMLQCSGAEILTELLEHLKLGEKATSSRTITIPRAMPRMSAILLSRAPKDRPQIVPQAFCNLGLIGQFVEVPRCTSVDISYGIRTAKIAVSRLMGLQTQIEPVGSTANSTASVIWKVLSW
ncbi:hypothetical protein N7466_002163 [Penicillium verhagenii]|uniref:uncharacterized protein n=1 Tax=Penicillium verhagenii TaxID=1562060 RepID=UPI00254530B2|nr:uncharacterized protein N7466_002163 [Penicillium verhagenii]KAJ5939029.1 hypothetical protein N7466_002163 [Penicillium verhagenii]